MPGSAKMFLDELIGAKDRYADEAARAKAEAEVARERQEAFMQQNQEKEKMIRFASRLCQTAWQCDMIMILVVGGGGLLCGLL